MTQMLNMTNLIILLFYCILSNSAKAVTAYFNYSTFYAPEHGNYVETYLAIDPGSIAYKLNENNMLQAKIEATLLFKKDGEIRDFRKYSIISPEVDRDIKTMPHGFIDLQRIPLANGVYNFELTLRDEYSEDTTVFKHSALMTVLISEDKMSFSDIQPVERFSASTSESQFTKSGYEVIPFVSNFYPQTINKISFYAELYNADKTIGADSSFIIRYFVSSDPSRRIFEKTTSFERKNASSIVVIAKSIDIKDLPSGNYNLEIEVRNKSNELLLLKKHFFQRSNNIISDQPSDFSQVEVANTWVEKYSNIAELAQHIRSLHPIAGRIERNFLEKEFKITDLKMMQQFFLNFWEERNSLTSENEWNIYRQHVQLVNRNYGNQVKKGYQTDRGRVYLQYGSPNQIIKRDNLASYLPYEIWHYYKIEDKTSRRFVFSLTNIGTQDYDLIHSNLDGEITNPNWIDMMRNERAMDITKSSSTILSDDETLIYNEDYEQLRRDYQD